MTGRTESPLNFSSLLIGLSDVQQRVLRVSSIGTGGGELIDR